MWHAAQGDEQRGWGPSWQALGHLSHPGPNSSIPLYAAPSLHQQAMQQPMWDGQAPAGSSQQQMTQAGPSSSQAMPVPPQQQQQPLQPQQAVGPIINGCYVRLEQLGTGAFGSVELVQEIKTQKFLAMKR